MDYEKTYKQLIEDFELSHLKEDEKREILLSLAKTIQKQFLLDVREKLDDQKWSALKTSLSMGNEFYETTLKHLLPDYNEVFKDSRQKIISKFKEDSPVLQ